MNNTGKYQFFFVLLEYQVTVPVTVPVKFCDFLNMERAAPKGQP